MIRLGARAVFALWTFLFVCGTALPQQRLTSAGARGHVGAVATVCGIVASGKYAAGTRGQPTFLNLDEPYPNQVFTILVWGSDRAKFGKPELTYQGRRVCATGKISLYRGTPEVILTDPAELKLDSKGE